MDDKGFRVRALGEVAIRCSNMEQMVDFYQNVIGLEILYGGHRSDISFFKIAEGFGGHTSVLALFHNAAGNPAIHERSDSAPFTGERSSLHHIALTVPFNEQRAVMDWYDSQNIEYHVEEFAWIGWRGIFTKDPEGNTVELVGHDTSLLQT